MVKNKSQFDQRVTPSPLEFGDRVLVQNVKLQSKHKLADKRESDVYVVFKRAGDPPVYKVRPETKPKPIRTLHKDLLLPCGYLPNAPKSTQQSEKKKKPATFGFSD